MQDTSAREKVVVVHAKSLFRVVPVDRKGAVVVNVRLVPSLPILSQLKILGIKCGVTKYLILDPPSPTIKEKKTIRYELVLHSTDVRTKKLKMNESCAYF